MAFKDKAITNIFKLNLMEMSSVRNTVFVLMKLRGEKSATVYFKFVSCFANVLVIFAEIEIKTKQNAKNSFDRRSDLISLM